MPSRQNATKASKKKTSPTAPARRSKRNKIASPADSLDNESKSTRRVSEHDEEETQWWKTNVERASTLIEHCMKSHSWDKSTAKRVLNSYRQFLSIKKEAADWNGEKYVPCWSVEMMWLEHRALDDYDRDMLDLCGHIIIVNYERPDTTSTREAIKLRFGIEFDWELWSSVHIRIRDQLGELSSSRLQVNLLEPISNVFGPYSESKGDDVKDYRFFYDGKELQDKGTPSSLGWTASGMKSIDSDDDIELKAVHNDRVTVGFAFDGAVNEHYLMSKGTPLLVYFKLFAGEMKKSHKDYVFSLKGQRLYGFDTAITLKIADGDAIDFVPVKEYVDSNCICCQKKRKNALS